MQDRAIQRLTELRTEFDSGQKKLDELEAQTSSLRAMLLRISGAIQVLEELVAETDVQPAVPSINGKESR